jgi:hypothetical protein
VTITRLVFIIGLLGTGGAIAQIKEPADVREPFPLSATVQAKGDYFKNFWRKIPCKAGSLRADIVVEELLPAKRNEMGAAVQVYSDNVVRSLYIQTKIGGPSPLTAVIDEHIDDRSGRTTQHPVGGDFHLGEPISVEVVWTQKEVAFFLREHRLWTFRIPEPTDLILMATGSRTRFDHISVSCGMIS